MAQYRVGVDEIRVHFVTVEAATEDEAQRLAEEAVEADRKLWYDHTEPLCIGDAEPV